MRWHVLLVTLAACGPPPATASHPDDLHLDTASALDDGTPSPCSATVLSTVPADAAVHVAPDASVQVKLSRPLPDDTTSWGLTVAGVTGRAALSDGRDQLVFTPDAPLPRGVDLTATAEVCDTPLSWTFSVLEPAVSLAELGTTRWAIALDTVSWHAPTTMPLLLAGHQGKTAVLQLTPAPEGDVRAGGEAGALEEISPTLLATLELPPDDRSMACLPTLDLGPLSGTDNPWFGGLAQEVLAYHTANAGRPPVPSLHDLSVDALVDLPNNQLEDISVDGLLDLRGLPFQQTADLCAVSAQLGQACMPCPDESFACLPLSLDVPVAPRHTETPTTAACGPTDAYPSW